ncbi:MAG: hypothetical protein V1726_04390 [Methanobacteriota archaeon]
MNLLQVIKTGTHLLLTIVIIILIITGLGITNYQVIEALSFGGLSKLTSYQIHSNLLIPLIILLTLHLYFTFWKKRKKNQVKT